MKLGAARGEGGDDGGLEGGVGGLVGVHRLVPDRYLEVRIR